jgi:hypothetical protein
MFLIVSVIVSFLISLQLQAADSLECAKKVYIEKTKLEIALCASDCPWDVVNVLGDHIEKMVEARNSQYTEYFTIIIKKWKLSPYVRVCQVFCVNEF